MSTKWSRAVTDRLSVDHPDGPIFRNTRGGKWTAYAINNRFDRLKKKIGQKFRLYDFRHGFITRSLKAGVDSHTVAMLAGHASTKMLDQVYSHINADHEYMRKQAEKASASECEPPPEADPVADSPPDTPQYPTDEI